MCISHVVTLQQRPPVIQKLPLLGFIWIVLWQILQINWRYSASKSVIMVSDYTKWKPFFLLWSSGVVRGRSIRPVLFGVLILPFLHSKDPCDQCAEEKSGGIPHLVNTRKSYIIIVSVSIGLILEGALQTDAGPGVSTTLYLKSHSLTCI